MRTQHPRFLRFALCLILAAVSHCGTPPPERRIKAVVVLMLENRSFDQMLGWLKRTASPSLDGLTGHECNPNSTTISRPTLICVSDDADPVSYPDPAHSFEAVLAQVFPTGPFPSMSGFVTQSRESPVMKAFNPETLPISISLAENFAVFDRWFSSIPGPTQPNRLFAYSATSHGATAHDKYNLIGGYPQKTIFDSLQEEGLDFSVYFRSIPTTLFYRSLRRVKHARNFHRYDKFQEHCRTGNLKSLSVIEPRYFDLIGYPADDDHPPHNVLNGQRLVKDVYEAMRNGPQWNESLLIVTYDEHGGFYDHVPTPFSGVPSPDGIQGPPPYNFQFNRLGVRVPTIMASPWIKKGTVVSGPNGPTKTSEFEHSSIPATIKKLYNLPSGFLTKRDAWAGTFEDIFAELNEPRTDCPEKLPEVNPPLRTQVLEDNWLSEFQSELVDLAAVLNGDYFLSSFGRETSKQMTVEQADAYVKQSVTRFLQASKQALKLGANESAIVSMRSSLTSATTKQQNR